MQRSYVVSIFVMISFLCSGNGHCPDVIRAGGDHPIQTCSREKRSYQADMVEQATGKK